MIITVTVPADESSINRDAEQNHRMDSHPYQGLSKGEPWVWVLGFSEELSPKPELFLVDWFTYLYIITIGIHV